MSLAVMYSGCNPCCSGGTGCEVCINVGALPCPLNNSDNPPILTITDALGTTWTVTTTVIYSVGQKCITILPSQLPLVVVASCDCYGSVTGVITSCHSSANPFILYLENTDSCCNSQVYYGFILDGVTYCVPNGVCVPRCEDGNGNLGLGGAVYLKDLPDPCITNP